MPLLQIVVLAAVQGITEFLPVSSSGHLVLVPAFTGWPDQGLVIDVAVHVGTLGAVAAWLWRDIRDMLQGLWQLVIRRRMNADARLFGLVVLATLPVIGAGWAVNEINGGVTRDIEVIAWAILGFGIVLWVVDRQFLTVRRMEHLNVVAALAIGASQILALIPGTSRAGITMTAARALGYERADAARFSMLLSIPTIIGAGVLKGAELAASGDTALGFDAVISAAMAFVVALVAITLMMSWLRRATFTPFVIYRVIFGVFLLAWIYGLLGDIGMPPPA